MSNLDKKMSIKMGNGYNNNLVNLSNSPASHEMSRLESGIYNGGMNRVNNASPMRNVHDGRSGRNEEIHSNYETKKDSGKIAVLVYIADMISGSVSIMYISLIVMLIINKNIKWFYILILIFIINICTIIFKILLIRFDYPFLYRPNGCEDEHRLTDFLHHNFILEGIMKKIDVDQYKQYGLPSIHVTTAASILTLVYFYFPKYKQLTLKSGIVYMILLGFSRIYLNCHTFIQVLSGLIFGYTAGIIAYKVCNK
jgi:membrane-associated phospholipid phosphatase